MKLSTSVSCLSRTVAIVSAALLTGPSLAQTNPQQTSAISNEPHLVRENTVDFGLEYGSGSQADRARFGMFNGLRKHDLNGLFDFNWTQKDSNAGRWLILEGRNLGLDNRELNATWRGLGDFRLKGEYNEITRHDPRTINTSLQGIGTTTQTVTRLPVIGGGTDQNLELKRQALTLDGAKRFGNFQFEATFKQENKDGDRFWGKGTACDNSRVNYGAAGVCASPFNQTAILMLPEPVDSTITQVDAKLNYWDGKLSLSGGYYGNFYTNKNGSLRSNIPFGATNMGNLNGGTVTNWGTTFNNYMQTPIALWPDSEAHQLFLAGNYKLASHTKLNFKYSYTHATQNESFTGMGLSLGAPPTNTGLNPVALGANTRDNLGGVLNTTKAQLGFASHPFANFHLRGDLEYSEKNNKTPVSRYNVQVLSATPTYGAWTNSAMSPKKYGAKLEGTYQLPAHYSLTGDVKYEREDTGVWTPTDVAGGITGLRQKMDILAWRLELRKSISETLTGSVSLVDSRADGASSWLKPRSLPLTGVFEASENCASSGTNACVYSPTGQFAYTQKNNETRKYRLNANWEPMDRLSVQGFYEYGKVEYHGPTTTSGLNWTRMDNFTLDATYAISDAWKVSAYYTNGSNKLFMGHSSDYDGLVNDRTQVFGAGIQGTPVDRFKFGADLLWLNDKLTYGVTPDVAATGTTLTAIAAGQLPNVKYELLRLQLFGEYMIDKASSLRFDYIYNHSFFNEWTYGYAGVPFLYSDNTTLNAKQTQNVNIFGARYVYKFQ